MAIVYEGSVFRVEVDRKRFPDGREHQVEIVRHPPSVVLIAMKDEHHVVLIRQYRAAIDRQLWELPAGTVEAGESLDAAVIRECEEEIQLIPKRIERLRTLFPTPGICDEEFVFYRVADFAIPAAPPRERDSDELIEPHLFEVAEAKRMLARGDIVDLKTAFGLGLI